MKTSIFISVLALVLTTSCKKQTVEPAETRSTKAGTDNTYKGNSYFIEPNTLDGFHVAPFISWPDPDKKGC